VLVFLGGVLMDGSVWDPVVADLRRDHRCVVPTLPGGLFLAVQALRLRWLRRLPVTFGWMSKRPLPDELVDRWLRPAQDQRAVRRDLRKYAAGARRRDMVEICQRLAGFDRPVLVVWTPEDRIQRPEHPPPWPPSLDHLQERHSSYQRRPCGTLPDRPSIGEAPNEQ
jgi:hypothetical protein